MNKSKMDKVVNSRQMCHYLGMIMANWDDKLYFENGDEFNGNEDDLELIAA